MMVLVWILLTILYWPYQIIRLEQYDLLLLDIKMPEMSGFELYRKLRLVDDKIKVCFITAFEEYRNEFNKLFPDSKGKGDCFIRKPVGLRELTEKVKTQLQPN